MLLEVATLFSPLICIFRCYICCKYTLFPFLLFLDSENIFCPSKCTLLDQAIKLIIMFWFLPGIVVTNDGNAILRELDLAHPAAKAWYSTTLLYFVCCRMWMLFLPLICLISILSYPFWLVIAVNDWIEPYTRWRSWRWNNICHCSWYIFMQHNVVYVLCWIFLHTLV